MDRTDPFERFIRSLDPRRYRIDWRLASPILVVVALAQIIAWLLA